MRVFFCVLVCVVASTGMFAQNTIGIPNIINYSRNDYHAGSQNWDIKQDKNGILYFANNEGVLSFDGTFWRLFPLPNKTIVRSLAIADDNRIYVGGQGEIGYFVPSKNGELAYTSLKSLIPAQGNDFADVWHIVIFGEHVFFHSYREILDYHQGKITVYKSINWGYLGKAGNQLYAQDFTQGLVSFSNGSWIPCTNQQLPVNTQITTVNTAGKDSLLVTTLTQGAYIVKDRRYLPLPSAAYMLTGEYIYKAYALDSNLFAFATNLAGCTLVKRNGEFVQKFSKTEGLQNNNVLSIFLDRDKNVWLGLDNGIDLVTYNNSIRNLFPEPDDQNSGYTSLVYNRKLYLGTATGLYATPLDNEKDISFSKGGFQFVNNTHGQVWNIVEVNGRLMMCHNKGAFTVENNTATCFDNKTGFWTFLPLYNQSPSPIVISGTYNGINFYDYKAGNFNNPKVHAQFESARFICVKDSTIWIAHPYKGLYKVAFSDLNNPVAIPYVDKKGILSPNHNHLFRVKGRMIVTSDNGIFEYNDQQQDFVPSAYFKQLFGDQLPSYLKEDRYGNIWFGLDKKLGVVDFSGPKPVITYFPELNNKIMAGGYENVYVIDSLNVIIAAQKGFYHLNYHEYKKKTTKVEVLIRMIRSLNQKNNVIFGGYNGAVWHTSATDPIRYNDNSLHFEYSSTLYGQASNIEYSYYLKGFDLGWSEWAQKSEKDYTNLPEGNYTFQVKCRNNVNNESKVTTYSFVILPPWYRSVWAYLFYILFVSGIIFFFYERQQKKYKRQQQVKLREQHLKYAEEQKQREYQHQLQMEKNEKEIMHLKNENLQAQLEHKNAQLATNAMSLVQKGEFLSKIKDELMVLKDIAAESKEFKKIIRVIDKELNANHEWEEFAEHFDNVHTNFLKNLKDRYPDLTPHDLKLCAYLRLSLSSKEIAHLMNISIRGVETGRYRLRKKLDLANDVNLFDFLSTVTQ